MKSTLLVLLFISILLLSGSAYASNQVQQSSGNYNTFKNTSNGISNFSVYVNDHSIEVFKFINVTSPASGASVPHVGNNKFSSLTWQGRGRITIIPSTSFSGVGTLTENARSVEYVRLYQDNYLGILYTTGRISETSSQIDIVAANSSVNFAIFYMTSPVSFYGIDLDSYASAGTSYVGNYSSFSYSQGMIRNFSLSNRDSSVSIVSNITPSNRSAVQLGLDLQGLATPERTMMLASDSLFPLVYVSGFNSSLTIDLTPGIVFGSSNGIDFGNASSAHLFSAPRFLPFHSERVYRIEAGDRTLGYAEIYGNSTAVGSNLTVNSSMYFVILRFLPPPQTFQGKSDIGTVPTNTSTEIFVSNKAYFIPFSPNITSQKLLFVNGTLDFQFQQNSSAAFRIVFEGNYAIEKFSLSGSNGTSSYYSLRRSNNETIVSFQSNATGQSSLYMAISPLQRVVGPLPLVLLISSSLALIAVVSSSILYSRKKWLKSLEKDN